MKCNPNKSTKKKRNIIKNILDSKYTFENLVMILGIIIYWLIIPMMVEEYSSYVAIGLLIILSGALIVIIYKYLKRTSDERSLGFFMWYILVLFFLLQIIYQIIMIIYYDSNMRLPSQIMNPNTFYWTYSSIFQGFAALLGLLTAVLITFASQFGSYTPDIDGIAHKAFAGFLIENIKRFFPSLLLIGMVILFSMILIPFSELVNENSIFLLACLFFVITLAIIGIINLLLALWKYFKYYCRN